MDNVVTMVENTDRDAMRRQLTRVLDIAEFAARFTATPIDDLAVRFLRQVVEGETFDAVLAALGR